MASAMIKGVAFQSVAADVNRLRQAGVISEADLRVAIKSEEAKYLSEPVVPGLWYPLGTYGRLLDLLCRKEGNDRSEYLIERGARAAEHLRGHAPSFTSTSFMVYTPGSDFSASHRAAASAPSANTRRSRASWTMRSCSNGASKITSCSPGTLPTRTLAIGIARPNVSSAALPSAIAVPEGASFLCR